MNTIRRGVLRDLSRGLVLLSALAVASTSPMAAQAPIDTALLRYINGIRAVDEHAHPMAPVPQGAQPDTDYDALPLDGIPPFALPGALSPGGAMWHAAQRALYGVPSTPGGDAYLTALKSAALDSARRLGTRFPEWALDRAGIDVMLANRVAMATGLSTQRFRWVAFADPLMLPLDGSGEAARSPDARPLFPRETRLLRRYLADLHLGRMPNTLDEYVRDVVGATLSRQKAAGAVGVKFEAAYLRPLDFDDPDVDGARRVYSAYINGGVASHAEYKVLQDYLFRAVAREAGRHELTVQIHVFEAFGSFYSQRGSAPHLLEPALNDSTLRGTNFVLVHGGWPLIGETQGLLGKPNVYTDISMMDDILSPTILAGVLRQWLGEWPEKVLFGTDAFDGGAQQGWEQVAWVGSTTARRALSIALTGMMRDGEITRDRAHALARMVLRENAAKLYGLAK